MTRRMSPEVVSAPLPDNWTIEWPSPETLHAEIRRASSELMWALHRQRRAWARMALLKKQAEGRGNAYFMDNERPWKIAVGDVSWWRGEVSSRSNALQAMLSLAAAMGCPLDRQWINTSTFGRQPDWTPAGRPWPRTDNPTR